MNTKQSLNGILQRTKLPLLIITALLVLYIAASWSILNIVITPRRIKNTITPDQVGLPNTELLTLKNSHDKIELQAWLIPSKGHKVVVLLHGIHSHAWDGSLLDLAHAYVKAGIDVLLFDLRGHGWSEGEHIGLGLQERHDVRAAVIELLKRGYEPGKIGLHGLSYGAATALLAGAEIPEIGAVIADSSFANARDVIVGEISRETGLTSTFATLFLPGVGFLGRQLYSINPLESAPEQAIPKISPRPVLLIHGTEDIVIPFSHAQRLYAAGDSKVELWPLPGYKHTEGIRLAPGYPEWSPMRERYLRKVTKFFELYLRHKQVDRKTPSTPT